MANLVLYRKYRPRSFDEVVGQKHVVQTLLNAIKGDLISHAYLFTGPRGSGKTTIARLLAKAVNCEKPKATGEPCNTCSSCVDIIEGRAIDFIEIDAASNRGIDEIRELKEGVKFSPTKLKYKVFVIDESHQLTKEATNALLKTLEEPPSHAIFILATTEAHKMIPTIVSRTQRFDFSKLSVVEIIEALEFVVEKEKANIEKSALQLIAQSSGGSIRDALSLLDKVLTYSHGSGIKSKISAELIKELLGIVDVNLIGDFVDLITKKEPSEAIELLNKKMDEGLNPQEFAKSLTAYLREALIVKLNPKSEIQDLTKEQIKRMKDQIEKVEADVLSKMIESFMEAENKMKYASIIQLPLELAIIDSCRIV